VQEAGGCLYASGLDAFQIQDMALRIEKKDVIDYTIPDNGFIKGRSSRRSSTNPSGACLWRSFP
jgi:hypothetical protein